MLSTLVASMRAFALAHIKFFGSKFIMGYLMLGLLFPSATGILPLFIKMRDLGILDSHWGDIIVQVAFSVFPSRFCCSVIFSRSYRRS